MFSNPYIFNPQASVDRINSINNQIADLEVKKNQMLQPTTPIMQNFQISPTNAFMKYANNMEEVERDFVIGDTPYFSKDMSILWIKNVKGEIRTFELNELIQKDEKDLQIEMLKEQIKELTNGKGIENESNDKYNVESIENQEPSIIQ